MHTFALILLIVFVFALAVLLLGGLCNLNHQSCQPNGGELDIPQERDFLDTDYTPCTPSSAPQALECGRGVSAATALDSSSRKECPTDPDHFYSNLGCE